MTPEPVTTAAARRSPITWVPSLYFAHARDCVWREGTWLAHAPCVGIRPGERVERRSVRFRTIGRTDEMPDNVRRLLRAAEEETRAFTEYTLVLALNYGARTEVADAARAYAAAVAAGREKVDEASWQAFSRYLYTADMPDPDLVIRTSGETRISNFLQIGRAHV